MMSEHHAGDLLAAYVLDAVTPDEAALVELHLGACAACRRQESELRMVTASLPALAAERPPPPRLKTRLMTIVQAEAGNGADALAAPRAPASVETTAAIIPLDRARPMAAPGRPAARANQGRWWLPGALAAMVAAALILLVVGIWRPWTGASPKPTTELALAGTVVQPAIRGQLRYFKDGNRVELDLHGLRPVPTGQVYELWLIRGHYRLIKVVGTFRVGVDGRGHLSAQSDDPAHYTLACLTVERAPGAARPTLPLVALGEITG